MSTETSGGNLHVAILSGGLGTRLWPLSTPKRPKPFLPLLEGRTLIGDAFKRARRMAPASRVWVVGSEAHRRLFEHHLPELPAGRLLLEPMPRNTAAAIALVSVAVLRREAEGVLAVLPADHAVAEPAALARELRNAAAFCRANHAIVCVGVRPTYAATHYGYLRRGGKAGRAEGVFKIQQFVEKPDAAKARELVSADDVFWNAGMFVFSAKAMIREFEAHLPELAAAANAALAALGDAEAIGGFLTQYERLPNISIDYAVVEKTGHAYAVTCECGWSDVGTWSEALRLAGGRVETEEGWAVAIEAGGEAQVGGRIIANASAGPMIVAESDEGCLVHQPDVPEKVSEIAKRRG